MLLLVLRRMLGSVFSEIEYEYEYEYEYHFIEYEYEYAQECSCIEGTQFIVHSGESD